MEMAENQPWDFLTGLSEEELQTLLMLAVQRRQETGGSMSTAIREVCEMPPASDPAAETRMLVEASLRVLLREED